MKKGIFNNLLWKHEPDEISHLFDAIIISSLSSVFFSGEAPSMPLLFHNKIYTFLII